MEQGSVFFCVAVLSYPTGRGKEKARLEASRTLGSDSLSKPES